MRKGWRDNLEMDRNQEVREKVAYKLDLADQACKDSGRSRQVEQDVLDILDEPLADGV